MNAPQNLPDPSDKDALRAWLRANRGKAPGHDPVRSPDELASAQRLKLLKAVGLGTGDTEAGHERRSLRLALTGTPVKEHSVESSVLGQWLVSFQDTVSTVAHALDESRPTHEYGPIPNAVRKATRLYATATFPSSYGLVLEEAPADESELPLPDVASAESLLDRAMWTVLDLTDRAGAGPGAVDAVIAAALPLGSRVFSRLADLTEVLADSGVDISLTWSSPYSGVRASRLGARSAQQCRDALRAVQPEESEEQLTGRLVGGSKLRGTVEIETVDRGVITARVDHEVTSLLSAYANRQITAEVLVSTVRSPHGREHHSYAVRRLGLSEH
ncbi:hypothetical protein [Streptomyces sp. CB01373]|uniref:hypothetical protein n=1 Tax=Streptomyces sp. CB01373 TaxID=2020325 RepID=UPI000C275A31|nr:hypothetical protein [Streptomyces sp. CB01373]PJM97167.1 hypothetical protein CG719_03840 [Streptomyces sp. CB01373]